MTHTKKSSAIFTVTARQLRREFLAELIEQAMQNLGQTMRRQHEAALRQRVGAIPRLKSTIGTPA